MSLIVKNKDTLIIDDFKFRCSVGKNGFIKKKLEGDKKTPTGTFNIGELYYRSDRNEKPVTKIKCISITKNMGWCDDPNDKKNYNKFLKNKKKIKCEKLYREDNKYDFILTISYNAKKIIHGRGSAIFIHLTPDYKSTLGCIAIKKKDMLILLRLINKKTKIKIL